MTTTLTSRPFAIQKWGDALRFARMKTSPPLSVRDLADRCGVGKNVVQAWEDGEDHPTAQQLKRLHASVPAMIARVELWRNETAFAKPAERAPRPMPTTPPANPSRGTVLTAMSLPEDQVPEPKKAAAQLPAGASDVAAAGVLYAVALSEVKAAKDAERRAAADHAAAVKAASEAMTKAQETLQEKLDAAEAAKKALDEAVEKGS